MHPVLLVLGPVTIYSFGFMLAVAVVVCSYLFGRDIRRIGLPQDAAYDFVFWTAISGILGARIFYILLNLDFFLQEPSEIYKIQNGGLAWQGGLVFGMSAAIIFLKVRKLPVWKFLDAASPYAALGQAIGRIGCFLNGCCFGKPVWWGLYFPVHDARLHPTQLYESAGLLIMFFILRRLNADRGIDGRVFLFYLMMAAGLRFVVQFFRDDPDPVWFGLSVFQWVALTVFLLTAVFFNSLQRKSRPVR